jgi:hypothetical protein
LESLAAFEATSFESDPERLAPPDTQVAAGPVYIVETVNDAITVWTRDGTLVNSADLNSFFGVPAGYRFGDPRLVYDVLSSRWFLSGWAGDSSADSIVMLGVSKSSDPTAGWTTYQIATEPATATDQPKIGVSADKVIISWNDYSAGTTFTGQETWVEQKADLLAGGTVHFFQFFADPTRFDVVPVISMTATSDEYLVYNNTCPASQSVGSGSCTLGTPSLGVVKITGTPTGTINWDESDPAMTPTADPPAAVQPSGPTIDTGDDRIQSAVWQNGMLWATANDACGSGTATRSCMRVLQVATGETPAVLGDADLSVAGTHLYDPAVTLDRSGKPFVVATSSSATLDASVIVFGRSKTSGGFVRETLWPGSGTYACSFCGAGDGGASGNRWGDYSGAAIDPANPDDVWVAGEYATETGGDNWGTAIGQLTFAAPTVTSVSPASGPARGGTQVTVHGANFASDASVQFGTVASASVSVTSPTELVATAPAKLSGKVHITVTTSAGTSATSNADVYSEPKAPPTPPPSTPARGYWMVGASGAVYAFGSVRHFGNASTLGVSHIEPTPNHRGYWIVNAAGQVFAFGRARHLGDAGALFAGETVRSLSATPTGDGYWLFTSRGRVLPFGDAHFYGDMSSVSLNGAIVGSIATPTGHGYYMVGSDGGIFTFGDAHFHGSMGNRALNQPVIGLVPTASNRGYWLVASDGGVFTFGDARFRGSVGGLRLNRPVIGIVRYGNGYLMVGSDGGIFDFSNQRFAGSLGAHPPLIPIVGVAATA